MNTHPISKFTIFLDTINIAKKTLSEDLRYEWIFDEKALCRLDCLSEEIAKIKDLQIVFFSENQYSFIQERFQEDFFKKYKFTKYVINPSTLKKNLFDKDLDGDHVIIGKDYESFRNRKKYLICRSFLSRVMVQKIYKFCYLHFGFDIQFNNKQTKLYNKIKNVCNHLYNAARVSQQFRKSDEANLLINFAIDLHKDGSPGTLSYILRYLIPLKLTFATAAAIELLPDSAVPDRIYYYQKLALKEFESELFDPIFYFNSQKRFALQVQSLKFRSEMLNALNVAFIEVYLENKKYNSSYENIVSAIEKIIEVIDLIPIPYTHEISSIPLCKALIKLSIKYSKARKYDEAHKLLEFFFKYFSPKWESPSMWGYDLIYKRLNFCFNVFKVSFLSEYNYLQALIKIILQADTQDEKQLKIILNYIEVSVKGNISNETLIDAIKFTLSKNNKIFFVYKNYLEILKNFAVKSSLDTSSIYISDTSIYPTIEILTIVKNWGIDLENEIKKSSISILYDALIHLYNTIKMHNEDTNKKLKENSYLIDINLYKIHSKNLLEFYLKNYIEFLSYLANFNNHAFQNDLDQYYIKSIINKSCKIAEKFSQNVDYKNFSLQILKSIKAIFFNIPRERIIKFLDFTKSVVSLSEKLETKDTLFSFLSKVQKMIVGIQKKNLLGSKNEAEDRLDKTATMNDCIIMMIDIWLEQATKGKKLSSKGPFIEMLDKAFLLTSFVSKKQAIEKMIELTEAYKILKDEKKAIESLEKAEEYALATEDKNLITESVFLINQTATKLKLLMDHSEIVSKGIFIREIKS